MTQLGETVSVSEFVFEGEKHDKNVCPWHSDDEAGSPVPMDEQDDNEDSIKYKAMSANKGGTLGKNLGDPPGCDEITVTWPDGTVQLCPHQWAPHHLIPGNESLKNSPVVPYLGDDSVIEKYTKESTKIIKGGTIGYDVNNSENGVWLPSPYALSMPGNWPEDEAKKLAYVKASIEQAGGKKAQFHMRHDEYSKEVRKMLEAIAGKMELLASGKCKQAKDENSDKCNTPFGLRNRLNRLSGELEKFLDGNVWRPPLFTDGLTEKYAKSLTETKSKGEISAVKITGG